MRLGCTLIHVPIRNNFTIDDGLAAELQAVQDASHDSNVLLCMGVTLCTDGSL